MRILGPSWDWIATQGLVPGVEKIRRIGSFFGERAEKKVEEKRSLIVLGAFNIVGHDHETMKALLESGFEVPKALRQAPPTNADKTMYYDQIAFRTRPGDLEYLETPFSDHAPLWVRLKVNDSENYLKRLAGED